MLLEFSAVTEAEKIIQEMQERIKLCKEVEDKAVAHIELSRDLNESLRRNGLQPEGWSGLRNTLTEIWELGNAPIDDSGVVSKLEDAQSELSILDKKHEQLKVEKQSLESKLSMTVQSNKELLLEKQKLESKIKELEDLTGSLDNSEQELNLYSENLQIEINDLKSTVEKLTAENNFYSQENKDLKKQKLDWVVNKDENQRIAQLESMVAELQSANQSLEWQKNQATKMVQTQAEQAIPQASWKVNDVVQVIGTGKVVKICGYPLGGKIGHFVCRMPDGSKENFFTGQLRFIQSGDVEGEEKEATSENPPQTPQLDLEVEEVVVGKDYVPPQERAHQFIKSYKVKTTTWEDFQEVAQGDSDILKEISMSKLKKKLTVKTALPGLFGDYVLRTGCANDLIWLNSPTFDKVATEAMSKRSEQELEQNLQQTASEFFATHNSPKKLGNIKWETIRDYAQGSPEKIDALIKCASASAGNKENSKTQFCDNLENLCVDYISRTGDKSDLDWVPFAKLVLMKLQESNAVSKEDASQETALSKVNSASILQPEILNVESKISNCKTVEQLEEISGCNPSNIQDADDAGAIVDIYEIHIERTGEFEKLNWLPESIQDEIYQRLGRGTRPLDFEIGEKVRGVDLYSAYCSKAGVVTRLTPGLISVAWEDGKFNTHYAEDLEIIPESLALQVA